MTEKKENLSRCVRAPAKLVLSDLNEALKGWKWKKNKCVWGRRTVDRATCSHQWSPHFKSSILLWSGVDESEKREESGTGRPEQTAASVEAGTFNSIVPAERRDSVHCVRVQHQQSDSSSVKRLACSTYTPRSKVLNVIQIIGEGPESAHRICSV